MARSRLARRAREEILTPDVIDDDGEGLLRPSAVQKGSLDAFARQTIGSKAQHARIDCNGEAIATVWVLKDTSEESLAAELWAACARDATERPRGTRPAYQVSGHRDDLTVTNCRILIRGQAPPSQTSPLDTALALDTTTLDPTPHGQIKQQMQHAERMAALVVGGMGTVVQTLREENARQAQRIDDLEAKLSAAHERIASFAADEGAMRAETAMIEARAATTRELGGKLVAYVPLVLRKLLGPVPTDEDPVAAKATAESDAGREPVPASVSKAFASLRPEQIASARKYLSPAQSEIIERAIRGEPVAVASLADFGSLTEAAIDELPNILDPEQVVALVGAVDDWQAAYDKAKAVAAAAHGKVNGAAVA